MVSHAGGPAAADLLEALHRPFWRADGVPLCAGCRRPVTGPSTRGIISPNNFCLIIGDSARVSDNHPPLALPLEIGLVEFRLCWPCTPFAVGPVWDAERQLRLGEEVRRRVERILRAWARGAS